MMDMSRLNRMHLPFLSNPDVLHMGLNEVREESWLEIKSLRNSFKNKIELLENFSHEILFENYEFQSANIKFFEALKTYLSTYYEDEYKFKNQSIDIYLDDFSNQINSINRMIATMPSIVTYWYKFSHEGEDIDLVNDEETMAGHFLYILHGKEPSVQLNPIFSQNFLFSSFLISYSSTGCMFGL